MIEFFVGFVIGLVIGYKFPSILDKVVGKVKEIFAKETPTDSTNNPSS